MIGRPATGKQKQLGVSVNETQRVALEAAAANAGHSVAEEIRRRIERTFAEDERDAQTQELIASIASFVATLRHSIGHDWHRHPAAHRVFEKATMSRLGRLKPAGEPVFAPGELPDQRLVWSDDPDMIGSALEAMDYHSRHRAELRQKIADQQPMVDKLNAELAEYLQKHPGATPEEGLAQVHRSQPAKETKDKS
jgi:hypothetical protein